MEFAVFCRWRKEIISCENCNNTNTYSDGKTMRNNSSKNQQYIDKLWKSNKNI